MWGRGWRVGGGGMHGGSWDLSPLSGWYYVPKGRFYHAPQSGVFHNH